MENFRLYFDEETIYEEMIIENTAWKTHQLECDYDSAIDISLYIFFKWLQ